MYFAIVEDSFEAAHAVRLPDGALERSHSHNWGVRATFTAESLDANDMVVDFCAVQESLRQILADFENQDLNEQPAFAESTPTAEAVARTLFDRLRAAGFPSLRRLEVTEAPGCAAAYEPP